MAQKHRLHALFDGIGLTSLVISIFALGGANWFAEAALQGKMLSVFDYSFVAAVLSFLLARCVQIAIVLVETPDPKRLRVATEALNSDTGEVVSTDIRRAA